MIITREWVDQLCPDHDRTSCSDDNLSNAYGGWSGYYSRTTGKKEIQHPRCRRCYLLDNIGMNTDYLEFDIEVNICLSYKN